MSPPEWRLLQAVAASKDRVAELEMALPHRSRRAELRLLPGARGLRAMPAWALAAADAVVIALSTALLTPSAGELVYAAALFAALLLTGHHRLALDPRLDLQLAPLFGALAPAILIGVPLTGAGPAVASLLPVAAPVAALLAGRALAYRAVRWARRRRLVAEPALVVGAGDLGAELAHALEAHPEYGLRPVGFVDAPPRGRPSLPVLGDVGDLPAISRALGIRRVLVAFARSADDDLLAVLRAVAASGVEVHVVPRLFEAGTGGGGEAVWGIPLVRLPAPRVSDRALKRLLDVTLAGALLLAVAPVLAVAALAVRRSSPGPALFRQRRVGCNGREFELLKLRTLRVNDDSDTTWSVADDERRTLVGRILRRTGIDELPQLLNVLRGEMSLVGPRPERPFFVDRFGREIPRYGDRHRMRGGITGWAQVHGLRGDTSIAERARFDNYHIDHWSLWRDVVVLARTAGVVLRGGGGD